MKKLLFILVVLTSSKSFSQNKSYFTLGYGFGVKTIKNAYFQNPGTLPNDMTSLSFDKDYIGYSNWNVRGGYIHEAAYFDMDMSGLMQALAVAVYDFAADKNSRPHSSVGIGKMRKIDEIHSDLISYSGNSTLWSMDLAFGGSGYLVGTYFEYSNVLTQFHNASENGGTVPNMFSPIRQSGMGHLGLSFSKAIGDESAAVFTMRVNRLRIRSKADYFDPKLIKRRGFEIYPSARLFFGDEGGIFVEAFYKYQHLGAFQTEDTWSGTPMNGEIGTLSAFTSHEFGLNLGLFIPYN